MSAERFRRLLAMLVLVAALSGCNAPAEHANPGPEPSIPSQAKVVVTGRVKAETVRDQLVLSAEAAPWAAVTVVAETVGRVVELPFDVGDRVPAGAVLARLDDRDANALLAQAEARQASARAALAQAERDLARGQTLASTRDISVGELDRLVLARDTAAATAREAEAATELARKGLEDTVIRAPFAGVVSARQVEMGSWLAVGSPVARVVDDSRVKVRAAAAQADRARLTTGLQATVAAHALPEIEFAGRVRVLGAESDSATGTYLVEVAVDRPLTASGARLVPGMQGTVAVTVGRVSGVFAPRAALLDGADGITVFRVEDGRARLVRPEIGLLTPTQAEILHGLAAGDTVVVQGQHQLADGDLVEPKDL
jgi:RND family efflux transporter MFP subunit